MFIVENPLNKPRLNIVCVDYIKPRAYGFRYSMNTVTSLKTFNPLSNTWRGADRLRCIHARIPFSTEIITHFYRSYVKASAYRYKKFVDGSRLGVVWHSATKLFPVENTTSPTVEKDEFPLTDVRNHIFFDHFKHPPSLHVYTRIYMYLCIGYIITIGVRTERAGRA